MSGQTIKIASGNSEGLTRRLELVQVVSGRLNRLGIANPVMRYVDQSNEYGPFGWFYLEWENLTSEQFLQVRKVCTSAFLGMGSLANNDHWKGDWDYYVNGKLWGYDD